MYEPTDDWPSKSDGSIELARSGNLSPAQTIHKAARNPRASEKEESDFEFAHRQSADDDDLKFQSLRAVLEKVLILFTMVFNHMDN